MSRTPPDSIPLPPESNAATDVVPRFEPERAEVDLPTNHRRTLLNPVQSTENADSSIAPKIPGYEMLEILGRGGMGIVWKARDTRLNRIVAIKIMLAGTESSPEECRRFRMEAEAVARLRHANIVQVYDVGVWQDRVWLALEYVEGGSLARSCAWRRFPPETAAALIETLANAVHHAHLMGIIHRDLKPGNILLQRSLDRAQEFPTPEMLKLTDFGLAKRTDTEERLTGTGVVMGTALYMAPEQALARHDQIGPRSDVYSLGVMLFEMLAGELPYKGENVYEILLQQYKNIEPPRVSERVREIATDLSVITARAMQFDPAARYGSAKELADDLCRFRRREPIYARRVGDLERLRRWVGRRPVVAGALLTTMVALVGALIVSLAAWRKTAAAREVAEQQRNLAEARRNLAETAHRNAAEQRLLAQCRLARSLIERSAALCESNDLDRGLLGFGRALLLLDEEQHRSVELSAEGRAELRELDRLCRQSIAAWVACDGLHLKARLTHQGTSNGEAWIFSTRFSPDGKYLLTGSRSGDATLWDSSSWQKVGVSRHDGVVLHVEFSADGSHYLAFVVPFNGAHPEVRVYRTQDQTPIGRPLPHCPTSRLGGRTEIIGLPHFAGRGIRVWTMPEPNWVHLRDPIAGGAIARIPIQGIAPFLLPSEERLLIVAADGSVREWDEATGKLIRHVHPGGSQPVAAVLSRSGRRIAVAFADQSIFAWDRSTGTVLPPIPPFAGQVFALALAPDDRTLLVAGRTTKDDTVAGEAFAWDLERGTLVAPPWRTPTPIWAIDFGREGNVVLGAVEGTNRREHGGLFAWSLRSGSLLGRYPDVSTISSLALSPTDSLIALGLLGGDRITIVPVLRYRPSEPPPALAGAGRVLAVQFADDGSRLLIARAGEPVQEFDRRTNEIHALPLLIPAHARRAQISPDLRSIRCEMPPDGPRKAESLVLLSMTGQEITRRQPGTLLQGQFGTRADMWLLGRHPPLLTHIRSADAEFHCESIPWPDDLPNRLWGVDSTKQEILVSADQQPILERRSLRDAGLIDRLTLPASIRNLQPLATNADEALVGLEDGSVRLWNLRARRPVGKGFTALDFPDDLLPCGEACLTTNIGAGTVRFWDIHSGMPLGNPIRRDGTAEAVAFEPRSRLLAVGGSDGWVLFHHLPPPIAGRADSITTWLEVQTEYTLDEFDTLRSLNAEELAERRQLLTRNGEPTLIAPARQEQPTHQAADQPSLPDLGRILPLSNAGAQEYGFVIDPLEVARNHGKPLTEAVVGPDGTPRSWGVLKAAQPGVFRSPVLRGGYLVLTFDSPDERVALLQASGHLWASVNDEPRTGDVYNSGHQRVPVRLKKGANSILFQGLRGEVKANLLPAKPIGQIDPEDLTQADLLVGTPTDILLGLNVLNNRTDFAGDLVLESTLADGKPTTTPVPTLTPLTRRKVPLRVQGNAPQRVGPVTVEVRLLRRVDTTLEELDKQTLTLDAVEPTALQRRTFLSRIDGSVQYFAYLPPKPEKIDGKPGILLTLHGAAVEARSQAACWAARSDLHIVAPTNRRPFGFDWEEWGRLDVLEVLQIMRELVPHDPQRIYLSGHSMGGHGTWHLGSLYPDLFAAIGPSAGWVNRASYAGHGSLGDELFERGNRVADPLTHKRNLARQGVYILHGDKDDNVPIRQAHIMRDALQPFHKDLRMHVEPGAGHWWGNRCVDWPELVDFLRRHRLPQPGSFPPIDFRTAHPGASARCDWLTIEQTTKAYTVAAVQCNWDADKRTLTATTDQVVRLTFALGRQPAGVTVVIDGQTLMNVSVPADGRLTLGRVGNDWKPTDAVPTVEKNPLRYGAFKDAFRARMVFVIGTRGTAEETTVALMTARVLAEQFAYRGNGSIDIIRDTDFDAESEPERSVILFGHAQMNGAWDALLKDSPIQVRRGTVTLDDRRLTGDALACAFLRPRVGSVSAYVAVIAGTGPRGLRPFQRWNLFTSYQQVPDWFVLDVSKPLPKPLLAAGFFGLDWRLQTGEVFLADK